MPDAGWFHDPGDPNLLRWWDGSAWSEHTQSAETVEHAQGETVGDTDKQVKTNSPETVIEQAVPEIKQAVPQKKKPGTFRTDISGSGYSHRNYWNHRPWIAIGMLIVLAVGIVILSGGKPSQSLATNPLFPSSAASRPGPPLAELQLNTAYKVAKEASMADGGRYPSKKALVRQIKADEPELKAVTGVKPSSVPDQVVVIVSSPKKLVLACADDNGKVHMLRAGASGVKLSIN